MIPTNSDDFFNLMLVTLLANIGLAAFIPITVPDPEDQNWTFFKIRGWIFLVLGSVVAWLTLLMYYPNAFAQTLFYYLLGATLLCTILGVIFRPSNDETRKDQAKKQVSNHFYYVAAICALFWLALTVAIPRIYG